MVLDFEDRLWAEKKYMLHQQKLPVIEFIEKHLKIGLLLCLIAHFVELYEFNYLTLLVYLGDL